MVTPARRIRQNFFIFAGFLLVDVCGYKRKCVISFKGGRYPLKFSMNPLILG
jgi:hypothetical protein